MSNKNINLRNIEVVETFKLTPHLQRIRFSGEDLNDFPSGEEGGYVKVMLESDKANINMEVKRPKMRSYTVGNFDQEKKILTLDFVINNHDGHTATWAKNSKVGETIVIAGPGPRKIYDFPETDYFLMGDLTSQNAVVAYLKCAPKSATGVALIATHSPEDRFEIEYDNDIKLEWVSLDEEDYFLKRIKAYESLSDKTVVFGGGEATQIMAVKKYLTKDRELPSDRIYMSGYWKQGRTDEEYRQEKKAQRGS